MKHGSNPQITCWKRDREVITRELRQITKFLQIGLITFLTSLMIVMMQSSALPQLEQAQALNEQGRQYFETDQPELALESWQKAERAYRDRKDQLGILGAQLNQAKALESLGFYRRAQQLLEQLTATQQPDSTLKANQFLTLGKNLRLIGDFSASQKALETSLAIAQSIQSNPDIQAALLQLGNTAIAQQKFEIALKLLERATTYEGNLLHAAQLQQIKVLQKLDRAPEAEARIQKLLPQLTKRSPTQQTLYESIELANLTSSQTASQILANTIRDARHLKNRRVESYAIGNLAHRYEQSKQWSEAAQLTDQALKLAIQLDIPEIAYQWQWQLGRILKAQSKIQPAAIAYADAIDSLKTLRRDIAAIDQSIQFSFREQIEPVYREFVDLLLTDPVSQPNLRKAREVIESLRLAELNNFFREACLNSSTQSIESIDPTAAVLYPIILPNRLEVILSLPNQPLKHFTVLRSHAEIEETIFKMRQSLRPTSFDQERLPLAQTLYSWLIQPARPDLEAAQIKTIAFVLDGALRNIPMAALHNGQQYLIEEYQVARIPSLHLFTAPKPKQSQALIAGLSEAVRDQIPLPGVQQEVEQIQKMLPSKVLLNQDFTTQAFQESTEQTNFSIVHLATHGQFSSNPEETFLLTWDSRINLEQLRTILNNRELEQSTSIDLLVLSACQTAQSDRRSALGLAGVAVRTGATSTLASLWTVNDVSTTAFMLEFYNAFLGKQQRSKAEAVRQAQLKLLEQKEFRHPYYWASFVLIGRWF